MPLFSLPLGGGEEGDLPEPNSVVVLRGHYQPVSVSSLLERILALGRVRPEALRHFHERIVGSICMTIYVHKLRDKGRVFNGEPIK